MSSISLYNNQPGFTNRRATYLTYLDVERIKNNPVYKCTIGSTSDGFKFWGGIEGIYNPDSPFNVNVGSSYNDSFELPFDTAKLNTALGFAANMSNQTQFIFKSLRMTEQRWAGSTSPEFTVKIDIPIIRKTDACWTVLDYLLRATSGSLNDNAGGSQVQSVDSAARIFAPNGYKIEYSTSANTQDTPKGTYVVQLGSGDACWFKMFNALITNMDFSIGNKKYYDGNPTSVTCTVHFKFWRQPLYEDIRSWFPKLTDSRYR